MAKPCEEWEDWEEEQAQSDTTTTWKEFKKFFNRKFLTYDNQQETLCDATIANNATKTEMDELQDHFISVTPLLQLYSQNVIPKLKPLPNKSKCSVPDPPMPQPLQTTPTSMQMTPLKPPPPTPLPRPLLT